MVFDDKTEGGYNLKVVKIPAYSIIVVNKKKPMKDIGGKRIKKDLAATYSPA